MIRKYGRDCGPMTLQFKIVGLNEVKRNEKNVGKGSGEVNGRAPKIDGPPLLALDWPVFCQP
jgi:hypothetical protein